MQFELSKLLESALEEDDELDKIKQINKVFKVINDTMPYPDRLSEISKDTFLMKNLLLCRPYHQKSVRESHQVDFIMELLEESLSDSKLFLVNYMKSLCEVVALGAASTEKVTLGASNVDPLLLYSPDRHRIRDLTLEEFKAEVNMTVKRINQAISSSLGGVKSLSLQKVEKIASLILRVSLSNKHNHDTNINFNNKIVPYFIKYFKSLFENAGDAVLIKEGLDLLKTQVEKFGSFGKAVDLKEMEKIAKGVNRKIKEKDNQSPSNMRREIKRKDEEERDEIERKLRKYQFKLSFKRFGLMEAIRDRILNFAKWSVNNRKAKKLLESIGRPL